MPRIKCLAPDCGAPKTRNQAMMFFTTQRLRTRTFRDPGRGIDQFFECEFMGSAEFEYGALPTALKSFRDSTNLIVTEHGLTTDGVTRPVFLVSDLAVSAELGVELQNWLDANCPGQEASRFKRRFANGDDETGYETSCWWSISDDAAWSFDEELANKFLSGLLDTSKVS